MKKIILISLMVVVLCTTLVTFTACGFNVDAEDMLALCNKALEPVALGDGKSIAIYADVYSVAVHSIGGDKITIQYVNNANAIVEAKVRENGLEIKQTTSNTTVSLTNLYLVVGIPQSWNSYDLGVKLDVGSVSIEDLTLDSLDVDLTVGSANLDVEMANYVDVEVEAGSIDMEGNAVSVNLHSNAGTVKADISAQKVDLSTDTGKISFEIEDALEIDLETDTGVIRGKIEGAQSSYTIVKDVWYLGKCNLDDQTGDGVHVLEISVETGVANVKFVN